jgi:hypothetical protein
MWKLHPSSLSRVCRIGLGLAAWSALLGPSTLAAGDGAFQNGDVFAGVAGGRISRFSTNGNSRGSLSAGSAGQMAGMCFDLDGNLYATDFEKGVVSKFDKNGKPVSRRWGGPFNLHPESCVVDAESNVYTGEVDGENRIRKFDANGRFIASFKPRTEGRGLDWIDLAADQCTMFYSSEGGKVMRFDVCRDRQLEDFARGLEKPCYALRIRENGEVLAACKETVYRLSTKGTVVKTYPIAGDHLFAMNLDPDGEHFWTGGLFSGQVYKVHIGTGKGTERPVFRALEAATRDDSLWGQLQRLGDLFDRAAMGGLAVYGERTAAVAEVVRKQDEERREAQRREEERRQEAARQAEEQRQQAAARAKEESQREAARLAEEQRRREAARLEEEETRRREAARLAEEERQRREAERRAEEERRRQEEEERRRRTGPVTFGPPSSVQLGTVASEATGQGRLDLAGTRVEGSSLARLTTDLDADGVALEMETPEGWKALGRTPVELPLDETGARQWSLRVRVGKCTEGVPGDVSHHLLVEAPGPDQGLAKLEVPLALQVEKSPWLRCWGPALAGAFGLVLLGVVIHGFVSPSRFGPRIGVVLSPEEDMSEGFFHAIRAQRGSGSGFYRDARIYVTRDYRLTGKAAGAAARLRAEGKQVSLQPLPGASLLRQTADGDWEPVPAEEGRMRAGVVYRDEMKTLFFELGNR